MNHVRQPRPSRFHPQAAQGVVEAMTRTESGESFWFELHSWRPAQVVPARHDVDRTVRSPSDLFPPCFHRFSVSTTQTVLGYDRSDHFENPQEESRHLSVLR